MRVSRLGALSAVFALATLAACREELTAPGNCPALCPGSNFRVLDTIIDADAGGDTSFTGYTARGQGQSFLVTDNLAGLPEMRGLMRFFPRPDSVTVGDTLRAYTIDSVALSLTLSHRDTAMKGLRVLLYRMPAPRSVDSTTDFATVSAALVEANLVDSIAVDDSVESRLLSLRYTEPEDVARLDIPAADSGTLALAIAVRADGPTGARFVALGTGAPTFTTFVSADVEDEEEQDQSIFRSPTLITWVQEAPDPADPDLLAVGGAPSSRSLIRFSIPDIIRDSATISRATVELTLTQPLAGLAGDSADLSVRAVLSDLGAKSPTAAASGATTRLGPGVGGTIEFDITAAVRAWLGEDGLPPAVMLILAPEAASFLRPVFASSRAGGPLPKVHITYTLPVNFGEQ